MEQQHHESASRKHRKPRLFVGMIILLIILFVGGIGYFIGQRQENSLSPQRLVSQATLPVNTTPLPTMNPNGARTHTDTTYGFSFQYPAYWKLETISDTDMSDPNTKVAGDSHLTVLTIPSPDPKRDSLRMFITILDNLNNWTLPEWFNQISPITDNDKVIQQTTSLGGYQAIKTRMPSHIEDYYLIVPGKNKVASKALYAISFTENGSNMNNTRLDSFAQQELENFHKVLSTFTFTK